MIRAKKEQKNANFPLVQECVFIWEELRPRDATVEDKAKLVAKIVNKGRGKFKELSMNHSSSRVVQACLKYGSPVHRKIIWADCKEHVVAMSRSNYGSFVIRKFIDTAKKPDMAGVIAPDLIQADTLVCPDMIMKMCYVCWWQYWYQKHQMYGQIGENVFKFFDKYESFS